VVSAKALRVVGVPPSDLDVEAAVLSAVLLDPDVFDCVHEILRPHHFFADANRRVFEAFISLRSSSVPIDVKLVAGLLRDKGQLHQIGGAPYLAQLSDATPAIAHVEAHAARIVDLWRLREVVGEGQRMVAEASHSDVGNLDDYIDDLQQKLGQIANGRRHADFQTIDGVLDEWTESGPLVHEPSGIPALDKLTDGGPVYGTRWYLSGAPDAGKTALLVQIAHVMAQRGVTVGLLAVDEEAGDLVTRLAQRIGYARHHCEARDPVVLANIRRTLSALPLRIYDARWTVEAAAADVARLAHVRAEADPNGHPHGPRAMLGMDSIQTITCSADVAARHAGRDLSEVAAVTARVHAVRAVATQHRLIAIATSEMGRGAYRSSDPREQTATLASGKWSGAIEYSARVLIGVRSVSEQPDLIELELAKNKHGPKHERVHLRIDRRSQDLTPVTYDAPPEAAPGVRRAAGAKARAVADALTLLGVLERSPGLGERQLRAEAMVAGIGVDRVTAAKVVLGAALLRRPGPNRSVCMTIDREALPADLKAALLSSPALFSQG
jgi:KaiC/GvpD/RAD55 family RecA-like ATPase